MSMKSDNFEQKWGKDLSSRGWIAVPVTLVLSQKKLGVSAMELNLLLNLLLHWWDKDKSPYPSQIAMANRIGVSVRTVQRTLNSLVKKDLISKITIQIGDDLSIKTRNAYNLEPLVKKLNLIINS